MSLSLAFQQNNEVKNESRMGTDVDQISTTGA